jgi:signal transduction histidine kinase
MDSLSQQLLPHWPGAVFRQRADGAFEDISSGVEALTGHPPAAWLKRPGLFWNLLHPEDAPQARDARQRAGSTGGGSRALFRLRRPDGQCVWVSEFLQAQPAPAAPDGRPGFAGYWLDATRQVRAERALQEIAGGNTLGLITMGLLHDFNNTLAGILSLSETFLAQIEAGHPLREGLSLVKRDAQQAASVIRQLGQWHQQRSGERNYLDVNDAARVAADLLRRAVSRRVEILVECAPDSLPAHADAAALRHALVQLGVNAAEAMPGKGRLILRTSLHPALPPLGRHAGTPPRVPAICLSVEDTGHGIEARHLPRLFEPFFTTKPAGRGAGLGLHAVRNFAESHGGAVSVETRPGEGTCFRLWLPRADFTETERALERDDARPPCLLFAGWEDEAMERFAGPLRAQGAVVVPGGADAEDLLCSPDWRFDALVLGDAGAGAVSVVRFVRRHKLPIKIVLHAPDGAQSALDPELLESAGLVLTPDQSPEECCRRIAALLDWRPGV